MLDKVPPTPGDETADPLLSADPVVQEARKFFNRMTEWESVWRARAIEDGKFAVGDSDNGYQWPGEIYNSRNRRAKPCLTINLIRQHNGIITNQARRNKSTVKFVGLGNGATQESANVLRDLWRHVEWQSMAQDVYTHARECQVKVGRGWWRFSTEYEPGTFDQDIFVLPVLDPLSIYFDPDAKQKSGLDGTKAIVFDDVLKDEFYETYPELRRVNLGSSPLGLGDSYGEWLTQSKIRVAEYFRKVFTDHELMSFVHQGQRFTMIRDRAEQVLQTEKHRKRVLSDPQTRFRTESIPIVEWKLIVGTEIVDETDWPGKYIPLVPVRGEESITDGIFDSPGHTRHQKDPQRMMNYNASGQVEFVAGQTKTPWLVAKKAIEEFENDWATANNETKSVLVWNHLDTEGGSEVPIPPPQRIDPPVSSPAYQEGIQTALTQLELASGQGSRQMGQEGNERTGAAVTGVQQQSDLATYQWQDNYETALITGAKIFIDLVPKIYDTKRVKQILADDGTDYELVLDPTMRQAFLEEQDHENKVIRRIFNPALGRYDIGAAVGPDFASKRTETREMLGLILTQAPGLTGIVGDLLLKAMDFEEAQEAAIRLKRMVPPLALGQGPTQKEQELQAQLIALGTAMKKVLEANAKDKLKLVGKDQLRDIEAYKAETDRMKALADQLPLDPAGLQEIIEQLVHDTMETNLEDTANSAEGEIEQDAPVGSEAAAIGAAHPQVPGANRAPDGEYYLTDPTRKGKYLRVAPLAQEHTRPGIIEGK